MAGFAVFLLVHSYFADLRYRSRLFFTNFGPLILLWFATLPATAMIAPFIDPWVRKRTSVLLSAFSLDLGVYLANYLFLGVNVLHVGFARAWGFARELFMFVLGSRGTKMNGGMGTAKDQLSRSSRTSSSGWDTSQGGLYYYVYASECFDSADVDGSDGSFLIGSGTPGLELIHHGGAEEDEDLALL
eukprot:g7163.t1